MQEIDGEVLCVSQFTLLASTKKGNKPDFHGALGGDEAKRLYQYFFDKVREGYGADKVKNGVFQAMMEVALVNDGPVCLLVNLTAAPNSYYTLLLLRATPPGLSTIQQNEDVSGDVPFVVLTSDPLGHIGNQCRLPAKARKTGISSLGNYQRSVTSKSQSSCFAKKSKSAV